MDSTLKQRPSECVRTEFLSNQPKNGESAGHIAAIRWFSPAGGVITVFFGPAVVIFRFLNRLT